MRGMGKHDCMGGVGGGGGGGGLVGMPCHGNFCPEKISVRGAENFCPRVE